MNEYLEIALDNLKNAKKDLKIGFYRGACFWAQQSIELFFKAFLVEKNVFDPKIHKTHNLRFLLEECKKIDKDFEKIDDESLDILSSFATFTRYDVKSLKVIDKMKAELAIKTAEKVKDFVIKKLNIKSEK